MTLIGMGKSIPVKKTQEYDKGWNHLQDDSAVRMMLNRILLTCMESPRREASVQKTRAGQYVIRPDEPVPEQAQRQELLTKKNPGSVASVHFLKEVFQRMPASLLDEKKIHPRLYSLDESFSMYDKWMKTGKKVAVLEVGYTCLPEMAAIQEYHHMNKALDPVFFNSTLYPSLLAPGLYEESEDYEKTDGLPLIVSPHVRMFSPVRQKLQSGELTVMTALLPWTSLSAPWTAVETEESDDWGFGLFGDVYEEADEDEDLKQAAEQAGKAVGKIVQKILRTVRTEECEVLVLNVHRFMLIVRQMLRTYGPAPDTLKNRKKLLTENIDLMIENSEDSLSEIYLRDPTPDSVYQDCMERVEERYRERRKCEKEEAECLPDQTK